MSIENMPTDLIGRFPDELRLVAFDLDDTLAASKSPVEPEITGLLAELLQRVEVCVISGGQFGQFEAQLIRRLPALPPDQLEHLHLMPTCGTQYYRSTSDGGWSKVYAEDLTADQKSRAMTALESEAKRLGLWEATPSGEILEDRGSQITFSALGQAAAVDDKKRWDPKGARREALRAAVAPVVPDLEVRSGGSTSIDITRKGIDKAYGMARLSELTGIPFSDTLFLGDRLDEGGNDHPVLRLGIPSQPVTGWRDTAARIAALIERIPVRA